MSTRILRSGHTAAVVLGVGMALTACSSTTSAAPTTAGSASGTTAIGTTAPGGATSSGADATSTAPSSPGTPGGGGSSYTGPNVTINFMNGFTGGSGQVVVKKLIDQFNSEHKNIVAKNVPLQWSDIAAKMPLAVKAGNGPDVAVAHGDDIATYAAQGLLVKADDTVKALGYSEADFPPGLMKAGNYGGSQYAVPFSVTPLGFYVNKDVLTKAGLTDADIPTDKAGYLKALDALKAKGIQGDWTDGNVFTGLFEFESLLWQNGGTLYNDDVSKSTFNSDAGVQALTFMTDMIKNGYSPKNVGPDGNINALVASQTAFNWNGIWQTSNPAFAKVKWTAVGVPQVGTQKAVWSSSTDWILLNNKGQDPNKTAASAEFVKWMNDHSLAWAETGELPASNKVRNDPALIAAHPALQPFLAELEYAHFETASPGIGTANAQIATAVNEAVTGKKSAKQALDDAAAKADQILAQNKSQYGG